MRVYSMFVTFFKSSLSLPFSFFFFNDTATTEIYTLSPYTTLFRSLASGIKHARFEINGGVFGSDHGQIACRDRKSTRLNSSHITISYAVFCLKKKKKRKNLTQ